ncbi:MAG: hypothetical protein K2Q34_08615 [Alphaproteobacteria bacterium]|nr:hypothetical protein [Alphaproteobacteria bacterium]
MTISNLALVPYIPPMIECGILPDADLSSPGYKEITRRLPQEELLAIENKMRCLSPVDQNRFTELVDIGDLSAIIQIKDYPLHALYAVKVGKITQEDFATISLVYASPDPNKAQIPLFNSDGKVNPKARELIQQTLHLQDPLQSYQKLLTSQELDSFFEEMAKLPPLQRHFFLEKARPLTEFGKYTMPGLGYTTRTHIPTVRTAIETQYLGLNIFSKCIDNDEAKFMIPSAGMMQTFLNVKFKNHAVRMNFVLGLSSIEDIKNNGLTASRDAALVFPGTFLPSTADTLPAKWTDFTYHDFFHAIVVSCAAPATRAKTISLAQSIEHIANPALYNFFIDLEMTGHYRINVISKEKTSDLMKFFMDLELRLVSGALIDPELLTPSYEGRIIYNIARTVDENLPELKEYIHWKESTVRRQLEDYSSQKVQISTAIEEIDEEISTEESKHAAVKEKRIPLDAFKTLTSKYNFTEATNKELEDYKEQLEKEIESEDRINSSNYAILKSVKKELQNRLNIIEKTTSTLDMSLAYQDFAPAAKIIQVLENTCFRKPAFSSEVCLANATIPMINRQMSSHSSSPGTLMLTPVTVPMINRQISSYSSSPGTLMLTPVTVLTGIITLILLRVLFRKAK